MVGLTEEQKQYLVKEETEEDTKSGLTARVVELEKEVRKIVDNCIILAEGYDIAGKRVIKLEKDVKMLHDLLFKGLDEEV